MVTYYIRKILLFVFPLCLAACATGPHEVATATTAAPERASVEPVKMGSGYPVALVNIPVNDANTKFVSAALFEPTGPGPFPAVVILSGCAGVNGDTSVVVGVNRGYLAKGIATLVLDSFTPRGIAEVCSDSELLMSSFAFRVKDAYAATAWLGTRPEIDSKHIFLQGYSHGAMTAIAAIDAQMPLPDHPHVAGVIAYYPYCWSNSKFSVPTIILIGQKDDWTPADQCSGITDKTNVEITVYPNAMHHFAALGMDMTYLGHHLLYDAEATNDGQRRALAFIQSLSK